MENTNAKAGLLAGVQLSRVTRSEMLVQLCGCKLRHNDNVNHNISLSHHLGSLNTVPWNSVCVCINVFKAYLDISDWQVLAVLCDTCRRRYVLKDQSEFANSLLSSKIQDWCTYHHLHTCRELHPLNSEVRVPTIKTIQILRMFLLSILKAMVSRETSEVLTFIEISTGQLCRMLSTFEAGDRWAPPG